MKLGRLRQGVHERLGARLRLPFPKEAVVPLEAATHVLLRCSRRFRAFQGDTWSQEVAFAHEMTARGREFAVVEVPNELFGKSVMWHNHADFVEPRLWNYAKQTQMLIAGLEEQGNDVFISSAEAMFWENKAYMRRRPDEIGGAHSAYQDADDRYLNLRSSTSNRC